MKRIACLVVLLVAPPLLADGGAIEINKLCVSAGCFNGDSPGYPVTLDQAGRKYVLTSDLVVTTNTTAILIDADDITLDLNGFTIRGPVTCSGGLPPQCTSVGVEPAPLVRAAFVRTTIQNGRVVGGPGRCIQLDGISGGNVIRDLFVGDCWDDGIFDYGDSHLQNVHIQRVGGNGFESIGANDSFIQNAYIRRTGGQAVDQAQCSDVVIVDEGASSSCQASDW